MKRPNILHLTFDYAENNVGVSTTAVADLINETSKVAQTHIISLTKTSNPSKVRLINQSPSLTKVITFGLPYGLFHLTAMKRSKDLIANNSEKNNLSLKGFDIIHAHKLSFEGIIGYYLAKENNTRLFVSIRQTDFFVLKHRKDLIPLMKEIINYASKVFFIAPYMKNKLKLLFGEKFFDEILADKLVYLPNSIITGNFQFSQNKTSNNLLTISWLKKRVVQRKNIYKLFEALKLLNDKNIKLDVIGYGDYESEVKSWSKKLGVEDQVHFLGFVKNEEVAPYLQNAKAFLMPSFSETFGVAYAESLLCGTPIMYSEGTGFDGTFENIGVCVKPRSIQSIANGIKTIISNNSLYRENIKKLYTEGAFDIFDRKNVSKIYSKQL